MELRRDDFDLAAELSALRPSPRPAFAAALDARAAEGFPRRGRQRPPSTFGRLSGRLRAVPPRRLLVPAGALAVAAIVVSTAVIATSENGTSINRAQPTRDAAQFGPRGAAERQAGIPERAAPPVEYSAAPSAAAADSAASATRLVHPGPFPDASQIRQRKVERSAQIVFGAEPEDVRAAAAKVFDAVHAADGIVLRSSIRGGGAGDAGANFDLLLPSSKLGDALAAFSAIAEVRSRREATQDITARTINAREALQDTRTRIESLLGQLAEAETEGERAAAEARLRGERRFAAALRSRLSTLERRDNFSRLSLRIETGSESASAGGAGSWGVDDALGDAGHILAIAAGVTVIGLAVLAPFSLICLLAWLAQRAWIRRRREQALS
jgi:hypothetical protein